MKNYYQTRFTQYLETHKNEVHLILIILHT